MFLNATRWVGNRRQYLARTFSLLTLTALIYTNSNRCYVHPTLLSNGKAYVEDHARAKRKSFEKGFSFKHDTEQAANGHEKNSGLKLATSASSVTTTPTSAALTARSMAAGLTARSNTLSGKKNKGGHIDSMKISTHPINTHPLNPYQRILSTNPISTPSQPIPSPLLSSTDPEMSEKSNATSTGEEKRPKRNTMTDISTAHSANGSKEASPSHKMMSPAAAAGGGGGGGDKASGEKKKKQKQKRKSLDDFASKYG